MICCMYFSLASKSGASTQLLELSMKPRYIHTHYSMIHVCCFSVMAVKGVTDFGYLLNPPLSVGTSINGFVKMVKESVFKQ